MSKNSKHSDKEIPEDAQNQDQAVEEQVEQAESKDTAEATATETQEQIDNQGKLRSIALLN